MKKIFTIIFIALLNLKAFGQIYVDIKQLTDAGMEITPQQLFDFGLGNCDLELVKSAIAKGADVNYREEIYGYFPLCAAINFAGNAMLPKEESIMGSQISDQGSAVFSGRSISDLRRDYIEIIRYLLQRGAKTIVSSDLPSDNIPLLVAAKSRDLEIIRLLLDYKANPNSMDDAGNTALHMLGFPESFSFPYKNSPEIAKLLISKGAKMTKIHLSGETPLASTKEMLRIVEDSSSPWKDYPFYNELVASLKSLIDIYSKL